MAAEPTGTLEGTSADAGSTPGRPLRADARRNYELLVDAAREEFAAHGPETSMEAVARRAGVGVGTLYRRFPKRIDLVEAVYRTDVDQLVERANEVLGDLDAWDALAVWLGAYVAYAETKRTFLNELREAFEKDPRLKVDSRARIEAALAPVLARAQHAGVARADVEGDDVLQLLGSMCTSATLSHEQAQRLLVVVLDGLRPA